jgi:hypothetical protein
MSQTVAAPVLRNLGSIYEDTRQRVVDLVREATVADLFAAASIAPACPEWRVRDVIAHLSGLATDIAAGNIDGAATDAWTAAQVQARRDLSVDELLAESDDVGPQLASFLDDFPGRYGAQIVADITVHEHDIRGALDRPGARASTGVAHAVDFLLSTFVEPGARALGLPALHITDGARSALVGGHDGSPADATEATQTALTTWSWPPGESEPAPVSASTPRLAASTFELLRAFTGRRSLDQIYGLDWSGDPSPYDALFALWPFTLRSTDLLE